MSQHKKKPIQYFFVDINDPDYYKRIKVARACMDCRKRKSKCDIGKPGSGSCSSCRKHNKICEFTATSTTILSSSVQTIISSPSVTKPYIKRKRNHGQQQDLSVSSAVVSKKILSSGSFQPETDFHWSPHQLTLIPFMVPEGASYNNDNQHYHYNTTETTTTTTTTDASQFTVTQEDNHLVGHLRFSLPVQSEQTQQEKFPAVTLLPVSPLSLISSHSMALSSSSSSSSTTTTPSPPIYNTNHACDATFPWKTSKSGEEHLKKRNFMRSVSHMDPVTNDYLFSSPSSTSPSELDLFKVYFDRIHPSYPALPKNIFKLRQNIPFCLRYAMMALSLLYYHQPNTPIPTSISNLAHDYYHKAWTMIQSRGTSDLVSAQTLLLLYKYHETIGEVKISLLELTRVILEQQQQQQTISSFGDSDENEEWICRLCWLVYLHQFNTPVDVTTNTTWKDPPMMRLPCLLPCEQEDNEQAKTISQFLDSIHISCVYTSAMRNLAVSADDPWSSCTFSHDDIDSSTL